MVFNNVEVSYETYSNDIKMINYKKENKYILISSILFFLIPIALISGPFLPDLFLTIISLNILFLMYSNKELNHFNTKYFYFFLIFCFVITIISLISSNYFSIKSSLFYFRFGLFTVASYYLIKSNKLILKYLLSLFIIIYIILFFDTIYQFFFSENILGFKYINEQNFRITSFFGKDEVLGSYTARLFPLLIFLIIYNESYIFSKYNKLIITSLTVTSFTVVLLSGERTSLALFILCLIFIFFSSFKMRKIFILPIVLIIIVSIISISFSEKIKNRIVTTTIKQLGLNTESDRLVIFSPTYEGHYLISYNMFKEKPLFGHGPKAFRFYCSKEENYVAENACTTHPHNFYAQMLAELGLFGFITISSIFILTIVLFLKNFYFQIFQKKQYLSNLAVCLLSSIFITLFPFLPSGNFFNNWLSIIIYYPLTFLLYIIKEKKFYA